MFAKCDVPENKLGDIGNTYFKYLIFKYFVCIEVLMIFHVTTFLVCKHGFFVFNLDIHLPAPYLRY